MKICIIKRKLSLIRNRSYIYNMTGFFTFLSKTSKLRIILSDTTGFRL